MRTMPPSRLAMVFLAVFIGFQAPKAYAGSIGITIPQIVFPPVRGLPQIPSLPGTSISLPVNIPGLGPSMTQTIKIPDMNFHYPGPPPISFNYPIPDITAVVPTLPKGIKIPIPVKVPPITLGTIKIPNPDGGPDIEIPVAIDLGTIMLQPAPDEDDDYGGDPPQANCIRGLPCIVTRTPNNPWDPNDGPNVLGPNKEKSESKACDADFMNQIYARAFLEAERENITAEILIRKPDSVLEYSCFRTQVEKVAKVGGPIFTETKHWHEEAPGVPRLVPINGVLGVTPVPVVPIDVYMGDDKLDKSLETLVLNVLDTYINKNFSHSMLGGYSGINMDGCDVMRDIYYLVKCNDMESDDQFFTFEQLAGFDPRLKPRACGGTAINDEYIKLAKNEGGSYVSFDSLEYISRPKKLTFSDFADPKKCQAPVPTGIPAILEKKAVDVLGNVKTVKVVKYEEKICINPGCYYHQPKDKCLPEPP